MGNHEKYARSEDYTTVEGARSGFVSCGRQSQPLRFGERILNLVGVDYQRGGSRYLAGTEV